MARKYSGNTALKKDSPEPLAMQNVLKAALKQFGVDKDIERYNFVLHWDEIVGAEIAKRTKPEGIRGRALFIKVGNSVWAQELSFFKEVILTRLKKFLNADTKVDDVVFVVGEI